MNGVEKTGWLLSPFLDTETGKLFAHVTPNNDLREHVLEPTCWCHPAYDEEDQLYAHNSADRREEFEEGRKPS